MNDSIREAWEEIIGANDSPALQIELCKRFLRDHPDDAFAWWIFGQVLSEVSRFEEAERALQKAIELVPAKMLACVFTDMGTLFKHKSEDAAAEEWYRK